MDNRLILLPLDLLSTPPYQTLVHPDFYRKPIILEDEPDQEFPGFQMGLDPFEMIYQCPSGISQILSPFSASPPRVLLSGVASRCSIIKKGAFPRQRVLQAYGNLMDLYKKAGYSSTDPNRIVSRLDIVDGKRKNERIVSCKDFSSLFYNSTLGWSRTHTLLFDVSKFSY